VNDAFKRLFLLEKYSFREGCNLYRTVAKIRRCVSANKTFFLFSTPKLAVLLVNSWYCFMSWHYIEKEYYDYADDIEGVNIHYVWTPLGGVADWENQRVTRFMPRVQSSPLALTASSPLNAKDGYPPLPRLRKKLLKLPLQILDPATNTLSDTYLLHHYFEVFQDGHRHYSPLYTEEINTGAGVNSPAPTDAHETSAPPLPNPVAEVKGAK
jgi:hypothetical protein